MPRDSRLGYLALVALVAAARAAELAWSARNARRLRAKGGVESGAGHYPAMVAVHAGFLLAAPLEVVLLGRPFLSWLAAAMLALLGCAFALRYWVVAALGERWCTRIIVPPGEPEVVAGPYRFLRHPNYLAVALEMPALALVHTAWVSAILFGGLNLLLLRVRIRAEDAALGRPGARRSP